MCKIYTEYHGTSEIEHGLCACTIDNPLVKARGLSLRSGAQTMLYLSHSVSFLFYPITLEGRRGTTDEFATIPFHLVLFSAVLVELAKSIPVHPLILSSHLFFCLPLFLFPFTVPCRIVFARPEDLETWPNHLSFRLSLTCNQKKKIFFTISGTQIF